MKCDEHYAELLDLFGKISEDDKYRLICRFILQLPTKNIASIHSKKTHTITTSFRRAEAKLAEMRKHDELVNLIQTLFTDFH